MAPCRQQYDAGAPDVLLRAVAISGDGEQPRSIGRADINCRPSAYKPEAHTSPS